MLDRMFKIHGARPAVRIQEALEREAKLRSERGLEEWIEKERLAVWKATCEERAKLGKGPVPLEDIQRAERCAQGHIDYTKKWAFYCEDLVLDTKDRKHWYI